jgi:hypothetical protein
VNGVDIKSERKSDKDGFWTSFTPKANEFLPQIAQEMGCHFIDLFSAMGGNDMKE